MPKYGQQVPLSRELRKEETEAEKLLWSRLRNRQLGQVKFRRQQPVGNYIVDFISFDKMLIIEIDGGQHNDPGNKVKDEQRTKWLEAQGYEIIRFWNNDVLQNPGGVMERIMEAIN